MAYPIMVRQALLHAASLRDYITTCIKVDNFMYNNFWYIMTQFLHFHIKMQIQSNSNVI